MEQTVRPIPLYEIHKRSKPKILYVYECHVVSQSPSFNLPLLYLVNLFVTPAKRVTQLMIHEQVQAW